MQHIQFLEHPCDKHRCDHLVSDTLSHGDLILAYAEGDRMDIKDFYSRSRFLEVDTYYGAPLKPDHT
jgi:hypothetical protein